MSNDYLIEATTLASTGYDLGTLIRFTCAHDPTGLFREKWGSRYQAHLDALLAQAAATIRDHVAFAGSCDEVLLCMAHFVATAPYLGLSEDQAKAHLSKLMALLIQQASFA